MLEKIEANEKVAARKAITTLDMMLAYTIAVQTYISCSYAAAYGAMKGLNEFYFKQETVGK